MNVAHQILAVDARYNNYRAPNDPQFKTLYLRRRSQLLIENAKKEVTAPLARAQYLGLRKQLLAQKYGLVAHSDNSRGGSRQSRKSSFAASFDSLHIDPSKVESQRRTHRRYNSSGGSYLGSGSSFSFLKYPDYHYQDSTAKMSAVASKAMAGNTTLSENYAFSGMFHIFDQHAKAVTAIKFAENDRYRLACCSMDCTISLCNLSVSPPEVKCTLHGHTQGVTDFDWSLSNDFILSSSLDCTARVWDSVSGQSIRVIKDTFNSPVLSCRFVPLNNNMIATGNKKGHIQIFNMSTGKCVKGGTAKAAGAVSSLEFDSSNTILWSGDEKGCLFSFSINLMSGKLQRGRRILIADNCSITSLSYRAWMSREARDPLLLVNCASNALYLFEVSNANGELTMRNSFPIQHSRFPIRSSFCPLMSLREGACVVTGNEDMTVSFFNVESKSKTCVNKLSGHSAPVLDVCWNYDESLLASCDSEGTVIVWKREGAS